jgi:hypothetical protein
MAITISGDSPNLTSASLTTPTLTSPTFAGTPSGSIITSMTAQASTSGTIIDFTSIPSWVKRVTVMFNAVSLTGTEALLVQIGDSGGVETTGYASSVAFTGTSANGNNRTDGYVITISGSATNTYSGAVTIVNISGNNWIQTGSMIYESTTPISFVILSTGIKTLSATLDRVRITNTGANTFDAGSINILYE